MVFLKISQNSNENTCASLFFDKVAGLASNFIQKELWHMPFLVIFEKILRKPFFIENLWWLLLNEVYHWIGICLYEHFINRSAQR